MSWFVYIIEGSDTHLYTGITTDVKRRWNEHLNLKTGAKYFRGRKPKALVFVESCENRSIASKREAHIKKLSRVEKLQLIKTQKTISQL